MTDHVYYEKEMKFQLREYIKSEDIHRISVEGHKPHTLEEIIQFIISTHKEYLNALKAVKQDIRYIIEICSKVVEAILTLFNLGYEGIQGDTDSYLSFNHS